MMMSMQSSGILASSSDEEGPQTIPVSGELQLATLIKKMSLDPTGSDSAFPLDSVGNRIVPKEYFRGCKDMVMTNVKNRQSGQMVPGVDVVSVIQAFEGKDRHGAAQTWNKWINEDIKKTIQADICLGINSFIKFEIIPFTLQLFSLKYEKMHFRMLDEGGLKPRITKDRVFVSFHY